MGVVDVAVVVAVGFGVVTVVVMVVLVVVEIVVVFNVKEHFIETIICVVENAASDITRSRPSQSALAAMLIVYEARSSVA